MARGSDYCIYKEIGTLKTVDFEKVEDNLKLFSFPSTDKVRVPELFPKWVAYENASKDSYGRVTCPDEKKYSGRFIQRSTQVEFELIGSWNFCSTSRNFYEDIFSSELTEHPDHLIIPDDVANKFVDAVDIAEKWSNEVKNVVGKSLCASLCRQNPFLKNIRAHIGLPLPSVNDSPDDLDYEFHLGRVRDIFKTYLTLKDSEQANADENPTQYILTVNYWG